MKRDSTSAGLVASGLEMAWENVAVSFERFCLTAGISTLSDMMEQDAIDLCGARHGRNVDRRGYRWGRAVGKLGLSVARSKRTDRGHSAEYRLDCGHSAGIFRGIHSSLPLNL